MNNITQNVETLYESAKTYAETNIEIAKLKAMNKGADLFASFVTRVLSLTAIIIFSLFVNIALSLYLGELFGKSYLGFLAVSGFYLLVYFVIGMFRNPLIKTPIVNLILAKLLKNEIN
jgi:hypothetical protein